MMPRSPAHATQADEMPDCHAIWLWSAMADEGQILPEAKLWIYQRDVPAWVYFLTSRETGLIKIGYSTNLEQRMEDYACHNPGSFGIQGMPGNRRLERAILHKFRDARKHGEWFSPTPELLAFIEEAAA